MTRLALLELPRLAARQLGVLVNFGEVRAHHASEFGQMGVRPLAMDEFATELILQELDGPGQRGHPRKARRFRSACGVTRGDTRRSSLVDLPADPEFMALKR